MLRYAITSGEHVAEVGCRLSTPPQSAPVPGLLHQAALLAAAKVDFLQLREKHLPAGRLAETAAAILALLRTQNAPTRLLINSRVDIALAIAADGVHLPASPGALTPTQVRSLYRSHHLPLPTISKACHTRAEVREARRQRPDLILFSPVFGKTIHFTEGRHELPATGLQELATACALAHPIPVLALGGVTLANTGDCLRAGARGVAGIRLFQPPA